MLVLLGWTLWLFFLCPFPPRPMARRVTAPFTRRHAAVRLLYTRVTHLLASFNVRCIVLAIGALASEEGLDLYYHHGPHSVRPS